MWDTPEDAQAVFADPNYGALIGEIRSLLIAAPVRIGHNQLHKQVVRDLPVGMPLFIHNTIVTVAPENTEKLISVLYSEKTLSILSTVPGFIMSYAFESLEEPGRIVSMSWWDTAVDAQTTFAKPVYAELLGDMRQYFIKMPERQGYNLLRLVRHDWQ
jgi:heme-degrading monooxygenase HmoA